MNQHGAGNTADQIGNRIIHEGTIGHIDIAVTGCNQCTASHIGFVFDKQVIHKCLGIPGYRRTDDIDRSRISVHGIVGKPVVDHKQVAVGDILGCSGTISLNRTAVLLAEISQRRNTRSAVFIKEIVLHKQIADIRVRPGTCLPYVTEEAAIDNTRYRCIYI